MNGFPVRRLACVFLFFCVTTVFAQNNESLDIVAGDPGSRLAGQQHRTVVELLSADSGVVDEWLYLSTSFGQIAASPIITDERGNATIFVTAEDPGTAEVTVRTKRGTTLTYPIEFLEAGSDQLQMSSTFNPVFSPDQVKVSARLIDENLEPVADEAITFSIVDPAHGELEETSLVTDAIGEATTILTIFDGLVAGTTVRVLGEVESAPDIYAELFILVVNNNEDRIKIVRPGNEARVEPGMTQSIAVVWRRRSVPVANQNITFSTTHGTLAASSAITDAAGIARTTITADETGVAILTASIGGGVSDSISIVFPPVDHSTDRYHTGGSYIPLEVFNNRIGIQSYLGVTGTEILEIANKENLSIQRTLNSGLYEFELTSDSSRDSLHALARRLEGEYGSMIRRAGLIVQRVGGTRPVLMTNIIRARFNSMLSATAIGLLRGQFPAIADIRLAKNASPYYEITLRDDSAWNIFVIAEQLRVQTTAPVRFASPAFTMAILSRTLCSPNTAEIDPRFDDQWHHDNTGGPYTTQDADIDSVEAWNFVANNETRPLIAVIDTSFSINHCEFVDGPANKDNLWSGTDTSGNIIRGKDFVDDGVDNFLLDPPLYSRHGTAVGGIIASIAGNHWGGRGVCYDCKMIFMNRQDQFDAVAGFRFAIDNGIRIINNSWGLDSDLPENALADAIKDATDANIAVLFAAPNSYIDRCPTTAEIAAGDVVELSAYPHVIGVSGSTDADLRTDSGIGNCLNVLGPTLGGEKGITTNGIGPEVSGSGYENTLIGDFGGTSAATPIVSGIAGLMLDLDSGLTQHQIRRVLQDTSDKIDPWYADYDNESGYSASSAEAPINYAFGRVNAFEAVSLVAPYDSAETDIKKRGKGGKDLLLRDHDFDWGNTEQPSNVLFTYPREEMTIWPGTDIKLDVEPFATIAPGLAGFIAMTSEEPQTGKRTRVYVRVRNRGPYTVANSILQLHWTLQSNPVPPLVSDFWTSFPQPSNSLAKNWTSAGEVSIDDLLYSGASIADCPDRAAPFCLPYETGVSDQAQVAVFSIPALDWNAANAEQLSLFVIAHSNEDPVLAKTGVVVSDNLLDVRVAANMDNNVTLWLNTGTVIIDSCDDQIITIIVILLITLVILIVIILLFWFNGRPVPVWIYLLLVVLLVWLIVITIKYPGCVTEALETLGIAIAV